jgi:hypothetical protein
MSEPVMPFVHDGESEVEVREPVLPFVLGDEPEPEAAPAPVKKTAAKK